MKWFKRKKVVTVYMKYEDPKIWRLEMFRRRGYIVNRYDMKEGK